MKPGIYRVWMVKHAAGKEPERAYAGRIVMSNGHTHVVEDRGGKLTKMIPDGAVDEKKEGRWESLQTSPYWSVLSEADLEPQEIHQPSVPPDEAFTLIDDVLGTRRKLEVWGDDFFLGGAHLTPQQAEELMNKVRGGELHLLPEGVQS